MVALAAFLGSLISGLLQNANPVDEFVYCSNVPAMNEVNIPHWRINSGKIPKLDAKGIPGTTLEQVYHANWALVTGALSLNGPPGAAAQGFQRPCVYWYGEDYPRSELYEREPNATGNFVRDASTLAQPRNGWFGLVASGNISLFDAFTLNVFISRQQNSWSIVSADPSVDVSLIGQKSRVGYVQPQVLFAQPPGPQFVPSSNATGLLGTIPTKYFLDVEVTRSAIFGGVKLNGLAPVPSYNVTTLDEFGIDNLIADNLRKVIADIALVNKTGLLSRNANQSTAVFLEISRFFKDLPHGALYFKKIDHENKKYSWNYHLGTDIRLESASNFPLPGPRLIFQQTQLDNAILRNSNISRFSTAKITQGLRLFPQVGSTKLELPFGSLIGAILYPFGISFLLPIFVIVLVQEKENRILVMMRMNGMKSWAYYLSHYVTMFVLFLVSTTVFFLTGYFSKLTLFTNSDTVAMLILLLVWGNNQISLAFFFSTLFNKSRTALVIVFLIVLCSVIVSLVIEQLFLTRDAPVALYLWPPFAFYRALGTSNRASFDPSKIPLRTADLFSNTEVGRCLWFMIGTIFAFFSLAAYFDAIFPTEFGIKKPWYFPITDLLDLFRPKQVDAYIGTAATDSNETQFEDDDVREERKRVVDATFDESDYPLVMKNMRKVYAGRGGAGPKLAVKDVTFAVEKGITFGLLGPNGAGKSTLISILTGLYEATSGSATLAGFNIKTETANVYKSIGICPQFDILWDELTIGEHLYFYARLKGVEPQDELRAVKLALQQVSLTDLEDRLSKGLSGGEKRRLSIAIALIGNPTVVFLDEPTTGLDPEVRRLIWNIVNQTRLDKTVILTTHSMEEAEALCQRIGIMARGTLRCIANPLRLKDLYGTGFKLFSNSEEEDTPAVAKYLESILPAGWTKMDSYATQISYEFPATKGAISKLFVEIEGAKEKLGIKDWGIGQTTLEEVFVRLISEADAAAEY